MLKGEPEIDIFIPNTIPFNALHQSLVIFGFEQIFSSSSDNMMAYIYWHKNDEFSEYAQGITLIMTYESDELRDANLYLYEEATYYDIVKANEFLFWIKNALNINYLVNGRRNGKLKPPVVPKNEELGLAQAKRKYYDGMNRAKQFIQADIVVKDELNIDSHLDPFPLGNPHNIANVICIPYLVTHFEVYVRSILTVFFNESENRDKLLSNLNIGREDFKKILNSDSPHEIILNKLSFMDIESAIKNVNKLYPKIDLNRVLHVQVEKGITYLDKIIAIINVRHELIHRDSHNSISKGQLKFYFNVLFKSVEMIHAHILGTMKWKDFVHKKHIITPFDQGEIQSDQETQ